jgi:serine/threonine protein kinase
MKRLADLPAASALEVDALCDDFERRWRLARRRGTPPPAAEEVLAGAAAGVRPALRRCLRRLERELLAGPALPVVPGLVVEEEIGRGGMGVVYRARRRADGRAVALKLIPGAEHARWSRWAARLADLRHPHLLPLEAFGAHDGLHYVVMALARGGDLKERLGELLVGPGGGRDARRAVAALVGQVAGAVAFLHGRGLLHRDLKPSNILFAAADGHEPLVCDFGLAGRFEGPFAVSTGGAGTPAYMAPEQMAGLPPTPAADVWGLGAVLYELLAGRPPFVDAAGRLDAERKRSCEPAPPGGDDALERLCLGCLRRDPATRGAAAELGDRLRCYSYDPDCVERPVCDRPLNGHDTQPPL